MAVVRRKGVTQAQFASANETATAATVTAECEKRFLRAFEMPWTPLLRLDLAPDLVGVDAEIARPDVREGEDPDRFLREIGDEQRAEVRRRDMNGRAAMALNALHKAVRYARHVNMTPWCAGTAPHDAELDDEGEPINDDATSPRFVLSRVVAFLEEALPETLLADTSPWDSSPTRGSIYEQVEANSPRVFGRELSPNELAVVGILVGAPMNLAPPRRRRLPPTIQFVLRRESKIYGMLRQRRTEPQTTKG